MLRPPQELGNTVRATHLANVKHERRHTEFI